MLLNFDTGSHRAQQPAQVTTENIDIESASTCIDHTKSVDQQPTSSCEMLPSEVLASRRGIRDYRQYQLNRALDAIPTQPGANSSATVTSKVNGTAGHQGQRPHNPSWLPSVEQIKHTVKQTVQEVGETMVTAAATWADDNLPDPIKSPEAEHDLHSAQAQHPFGAVLGHAAALTQGAYEMVTGAGMMLGGGGEAVVTSPAAATGVGAIIPAAGVATIVGGAIITAHGVLVEANTIQHILNEPAQMSSHSPVTGSGKTPEGGYRNVEIVDKTGNAVGEFDRIEGDKFIEEKSAHGVNTINPKTGKPYPGSSPVEWAEAQIHDKTVVRIENLRDKATATRATGDGSPTAPSLEEIKGIRKLEFRIESTDPDVKAAVEKQIAKLKAEFPDWEFTATFGIP